MVWPTIAGRSGFGDHALAITLRQSLFAINEKASFALDHPMYPSFGKSMHCWQN
jgi:hypothetical protein